MKFFIILIIGYFFLNLPITTVHAQTERSLIAKKIVDPPTTPVPTQLSPSPSIQPSPTTEPTVIPSPTTISVTPTDVPVPSPTPFPTATPIPTPTPDNTDNSVTTQDVPLITTQLLTTPTPSPTPLVSLPKASTQPKPKQVGGISLFRIIQPPSGLFSHEPNRQYYAPQTLSLENSLALSLLSMVLIGFGIWLLRPSFFHPIRTRVHGL